MKFEVQIEPLPQSRPRFSRGKVFEPARMTAYKAAVSKAAKEEMKDFQPFSTALSCKIKLYRKFKSTSRRFGDADNHAKAVLDACNGIIWNDDAQIVSLTAEKYQSTLPRVEVEVTELN
jgi:Holliday junction resolvase RusA-like endonuclease